MSAAAIAEGEGLDPVRLWLRMLSLTRVIEKGLRRLLESRFQTSLPRFDVMAALDRHPDGMRMKALSRELLVSNGNVTGLVRSLGSDGLIETLPVPGDARGAIVRLTPPGRALFDRMAAAHREWIEAMLGEADPAEREMLHRLLGSLKGSVARNLRFSKETDI